VKDGLGANGDEHIFIDESYKVFVYALYDGIDVL
jgi:hypothetical protein